MPTTLTITAGVTVRASQQQIWDLVVDWPRQHEWIWATRTEGGHGAGALVTGWTEIGPVGFADTMVITDWDPPRRCAVTHTGKVVRGTGAFEVLPRGDRCEFRWTERVVLPPTVQRLAFAAVSPVARLALAWSLARFARLLGPGR